MTQKKHNKRERKGNFRKAATLLLVTVAGVVWLVVHDAKVTTELAVLGVGNGVLVLLEMLFEG